MTDFTASRSDSDLGAQMMTAGVYGLFAALVLIYVRFGGIKFTAHAAKGLVAPEIPQRPARRFLRRARHVEQQSESGANRA